MKRSMYIIIGSMLFGVLMSLRDQSENIFIRALVAGISGLVLAVVIKNVPRNAQNRASKQG